MIASSAVDATLAVGASGRAETVVRLRAGVALGAAVLRVGGRLDAGAGAGVAIELVALAGVALRQARAVRARVVAAIDRLALLRVAGRRVRDTLTVVRCVTGRALRGAATSAVVADADHL